MLDLAVGEDIPKTTCTTTIHLHGDPEKTLVGGEVASRLGSLEMELEREESVEGVILMGVPGEGASEVL